jgi:hypothetical protein
VYIFIFKGDNNLKGGGNTISMEEGGSRLFRATCITATLYAALFLAHIVAAAKDSDAAFRTIVVLITILTFSVGVCIRFIGRIKNSDVKLRANIIGLRFALPLSVGLSWAYAEQSFNIMLTLLFLAVTVAVHFGDRTLLRRGMAWKMG